MKSNWIELPNGTLINLNEVIRISHIYILSEMGERRLVYEHKEDGVIFDYLIVMEFNDGETCAYCYSKTMEEAKEIRRKIIERIMEDNND